MLEPSRVASNKVVLEKLEREVQQANEDGEAY
jgi:hypothetical protein